MQNGVGSVESVGARCLMLSSWPIDRRRVYSVRDSRFGIFPVMKPVRPDRRGVKGNTKTKTTTMT